MTTKHNNLPTFYRTKRNKKKIKWKLIRRPKRTTKPKIQTANDKRKPQKAKRQNQQRMDGGNNHPTNAWYNYSGHKREERPPSWHVVCTQTFFMRHTLPKKFLVMSSSIKTRATEERYLVKVASSTFMNDQTIIPNCKGYVGRRDVAVNLGMRSKWG